MADDRPLVWWLDENSWRLCAAMGVLSADWPEYLREQFDSRGGRNGRGRLWSDVQFGDAGIAEWDGNDPVMAQLGEHWGGIVIRPEDHIHVSILPGYVTDLDCVIATSPWQRLHEDERR